MKNLFTLILVLVIALSLAACDIPEDLPAVMEDVKASVEQYIENQNQSNEALPQETETTEETLEQTEATEEIPEQTEATEEIPQETEAPHIHSYTSVTQKDATCTEDGTTLFTCTCGDSYTESIAATGHAWGDWYIHRDATTEQSGEARRNCTSCSAHQSEDIPQLPVEEPTVDTNYFFNENNNYYDVNAISIKPRYVFWQDGRLYAECFVINGFAHNVYNINVKSLTFGNADGQIASAGFGTLNDVVLPPYTHIIWTFEFPAECVSTANAELSSLMCMFNVSNNY